MFEKFQGPDQFAALWSASLLAACREKPGQRFVLDSFSAIVELVKIRDAYLAEHRPCLDTMTTDELRARLLHLLGETSVASDDTGEDEFGAEDEVGRCMP